MSQQTIIICGSPMSGLSFIGPFVSTDEALRYAEERLGSDWMLSMLEKPATRLCGDLNIALDLDNPWEELNPALYQAKPSAYAQP